MIILPFFLFSATAGQLADKCEKSAMIRVIKFCEIAVMGLGAAGLFLGDVYFLLEDKSRALEYYEEAVRLEYRPEEQPELLNKLDELKNELGRP